MADFPCPHCQQPRGAADACPACGRPPVVCGSYRVDSLIGRGGMGLVFGAARESDGERVAVKVLWLGKEVDWKAYELFERSCEVLQRLEHRGLPKVHAFERDEAGRLVLVREKFDGGTLAERVKCHGQRLGKPEFRQLLDGMLDVLAYLHGRTPPVLHRDIKPENIMFRTPKDWAPVLVDFDTVAAAAPQRSPLTIVCSPGYTAPEQLAGDVSPASDLYSLGATMLFVATHAEPDDLPRTNGRFDVGERLTGLSERTRRAVLRLVEPDRSARFASAEQARAALAGREEQQKPPRDEPRGDVPMSEPVDEDESPGEAGAAGHAMKRARAEVRRIEARREAEQERRQALANDREAQRMAERSTSWAGMFGTWVGPVLASVLLTFTMLMALDSLDLSEGSPASTAMVVLYCTVPLLVFVGGRLAGWLGLRRTRRWLSELPFPVQGYLEVLGRMAEDSAPFTIGIAVRGPAPDESELARLFAGLRGFGSAGVTRAGDESIAVWRAAPKERKDGMRFSNYGFHFWFRRLVRRFLLPLHPRCGVLRVTVSRKS